MPARKQVSKTKIIEAAVALLKEGGVNAVNIKDLAKRLNCSTQPIYLSFSSMEELRQAVLTEIKQYFLRYMQYEAKDSKVNLFDVTYILFAKEEKEIFKCLFMREKGYSEMKKILFPIIDNSIRQIMDIYKIPYEEAHNLHDQLWVHTHGIAVMVASEFCEWDMNTVVKMLEETKALLFTKYTSSEIIHE